MTRSGATRLSVVICSDVRSLGGERQLEIDSRAVHGLRAHLETAGDLLGSLAHALHAEAAAVKQRGVEALSVVADDEPQSDPLAAQLDVHLAGIACLRTLLSASRQTRSSSPCTSVGGSTVSSMSRSTSMSNRSA